MKFNGKFKGLCIFSKGTALLVQKGHCYCFAFLISFLISFNFFPFKILLRFGFPLLYSHSTGLFLLIFLVEISKQLSQRESQHFLALLWWNCLRSTKRESYFLDLLPPWGQGNGIVLRISGEHIVCWLFVSKILYPTPSQLALTTRIS